MLEGIIRHSDINILLNCVNKGLFGQSGMIKRPVALSKAFTNGLFCWPCLLFTPGVSQSWTERGYTNLRNVLSDGKKHEKSTAYLEAYKMWKTYDVSERVDVMFSRARREEIEQHNDEVRQNRGMLRTLSEADLYLSRQELPSRGHDESSNSLNRETIGSLWNDLQSVILLLNVVCMVRLANQKGQYWSFYWCFR